VNPARIVRRSSEGLLAVVALALGAVALPAYGAYKQANPQPASAATPAKVTYAYTCDGRRIAHAPRKPLDPSVFGWAGGAVALAGVLAEWSVRRQIDLVRRGSVAEAIVDEVHHKRSRHDSNWMRYGFGDAHGQWHSGKSTIGECDAAVLSTGSRVLVFYDPANPRRNLPEQGLWAVTWDDEGAPA
jgi:hypothetical protein